MDRRGHSRHKSHSQSVQCTRPSHCLRQQWCHNPIQPSDVPIATWRTLLRAHVNGTEIVWKSTDWRWNLSLFLYGQVLIHGCLTVFISRVIRWNCFSKMWHISLACILQNNDLQCQLKTAGVITNDGSLECIILYNALYTMHAGETMHRKPCYNYWHVFHSSGFHHICNIKCRLDCRYSPQNIFDAKNFNPHKKPISLLNVPICTQGMQLTWWPEAGTIIVTDPY